MDIDRLNTEQVAQATGVDQDDVERVLAHLVPNWLLVKYIEDMDLQQVYQRKQEQ